MCFSATASFAASAVLGGAGALALSKVKQKRDYFIALIPIIFAFQQFLEGFVWLTFGRGLVTQLFAYGFLFFAFVLWPVYVPFAALSYEHDPRRKEVMRFLVFFGFVVAVYLLIVLFTQPLHIELSNGSICYRLGVPFEVRGVTLYLCVTVGTLIFSTNLFIRYFGVLMLSSAMIAWVVYETVFTSVWCFFAAVLSALIIVFFLNRKSV